MRAREVPTAEAVSRSRALICFLSVGLVARPTLAPRRAGWELLRTRSARPPHLGPLPLRWPPAYVASRGGRYSRAAGPAGLVIPSTCCVTLAGSRPLVTLEIASPAA